MGQRHEIYIVKGCILKKGIIFYIVVSVLWVKLLYPLELVAQDNVTIQSQPNIIIKPEPPLGVPTPISLPDLGDVSSASLSEMEEVKLGDRIMREIRKDPDYVTNWLLYDYINQLGRQLVAGAREEKISGAAATGEFGPKFEFFTVRDSSINAFALPGGYVGVHTGLMVLTDNESQLASVLGHEIGHVTQKHIARGAGQGATSSILMLASLVLAIVAAKSNPGAAQGLAIGGQALAIQNQLSYSRDAEREADRIGFQILKATGFDLQAMPAFFLKLQKATGMMDSGTPAFVRTHPLTSERIAEMQDRVRIEGGQKTVLKNSLDFYLNQTIARFEQESLASQASFLKDYFQDLQSQANIMRQMQGNFGMCLLAIRDKKTLEAEKYLLKTKELSQRLSPLEVSTKTSEVFDITLGQIAIQKNNFSQAISLAQHTMANFPASKAAGVLLVQAHYASGNYQEGVVWLEQKTKIQRDDSTWWNYLAQGYEKLDRQTAYHVAIAEKYVDEGALPAAIKQLTIAKEMSSTDYYQLSEIEARKRQLEMLYREELKENNKLPKL